MMYKEWKWLLVGLLVAFTSACGSSSKPDADKDGVADSKDNCMQVKNVDQLDLDGDGIGNACDDDIDGDTVLNDDDAFPEDATETVDADSDGIGDNKDLYRNNSNPYAFQLSRMVEKGRAIKVINDKAYGKQNAIQGFGEKVDAIGDVNGDGIDDFMITNPYYIENSFNAGIAYLIFGRSESWPAEVNLNDLSNIAHITFVQDLDANDYALVGEGYDGIGDVNGDGIDDFVLNAGFYDLSGSGNFSGGLFIVHGREDWSVGEGSDGFITLAELKANSVSYYHEGVNDAVQLGKTAKNIGDINNDGYVDIAVTRSTDGVTQDRTFLYGRVEVLFGGPQWHSDFNGTSYSIPDLDNSIERKHFYIQDVDGFHIKDGLGFNIEPLGDFNDDGYDDFVITDNGYLHSSVGAVVVVFGRPRNEWADGYTTDNFTNEGEFFIIKDNVNLEETIGQYPAIGDFNGDSNLDLALASSGLAAGALTIIWGGNDSYPLMLDRSQVTDSIGVVLIGEERNTALGPSLLSMPDWNGDGIDELLIGTEYQSNNLGLDNPDPIDDVFILYGKNDWSLGDLGEGTVSENQLQMEVDVKEHDHFYDWIRQVGDINNDGLMDFSVSAQTNGEFGEIYIVFGFSELYSE